MSGDSILKSIPAWVQVGVTVGGLVFGGGVLYADVQDIKVGLERSESVISRHSEMVGQISGLEIKLTSAEKVNEKVIAAVEKLSGAVEILSINVARLEERTSRKR
jgi:hypothetical protein